MPAPKMSGNDMLLAMKRGKLGPANDAPVGSSPVPDDPDAAADAMPPSGGSGDPVMDLSAKVDSLTDMVQQIADKVGVAAQTETKSPIPPMEQAAEMSA